MHEREHAAEAERAAGRVTGAAARDPRHEHPRSDALSDRQTGASGDPRRSPAALLRMQSSAGNRATARWLAREKVEGPSRALLGGEVTPAAGGMASAAAGRTLRTAKDDEARAGQMLTFLGIPPAAEGKPKPVADEATKKAAEAASGLAMAGAEMSAQGVIENLLRGGGPKAS